MDFINKIDTKFTKLFNNYSASPCLMITCKMDSGQEIFLKLFANVQDENSKKKLIDDDHDECNYYNKEKQYAGLIYETKIYNKKINPIIKNKLSNNFINFLGIYDLNHDELLTKILPSTYVESEQFRKKLKLKDDAVLDSDIKYKMSIFEFKKNRNLKSWIANYLDFGKIKDESIGIGDKCYQILWQVLFQIASACYLLSLSKINHNDLHEENVIIETLDEEKTFVYIINDKRYTIKTKHVVYIYDFDMSFSQNLGVNKINEITKFDNENINIVSLMCYFSSLVHDSKLCEILNILSSEKKSIYDLLNVNNEFRNCQNLFSGEKYYDSQTILNNISSFLDPDLSFDGVVKDNIFVCNKGMFNDDGDIYIDIVKKNIEKSLESLESFKNGIEKKEHDFHFEYNGVSCLSNDDDVSFVKTEKDETASEHSLRFKTNSSSSADSSESRPLKRSRLDSESNLLSPISPISPMSSSSFDGSAKKRSTKKLTTSEVKTGIVLRTAKTKIPHRKKNRKVAKQIAHTPTRIRRPSATPSQSGLPESI